VRARWVDTRQEVGAKHLGVVDGSSSQTGVANIATGRNNARNEALEHAAEKGTEIERNEQTIERATSFPNTSRPSPVR
jgi:hypothetical protein